MFSAARPYQQATRGVVISIEGGLPRTFSYRRVLTLPHAELLPPPIAEIGGCGPRILNLRIPVEVRA
jgi:hypothetical protein